MRSSNSLISFSLAKFWFLYKIRNGTLVSRLSGLKYLTQTFSHFLNASGKTSVKEYSVIVLVVKRKLEAKVVLRDYETIRTEAGENELCKVFIMKKRKERIFVDTLVSIMAFLLAWNEKRCRSNCFVGFALPLVFARTLLEYSFYLWAPA